MKVFAVPFHSLKRSDGSINDVSWCLKFIAKVTVLPHSSLFSKTVSKTFFAFLQSNQGYKILVDHGSHNLHHQNSVLKAEKTEPF